MKLIGLIGLSFILITSCVKPKACLNVDKTTLVVSEVTEFRSCSENTGWEEWDFGDGNTKIGKAVSHGYLQVGVYEVKLTAHFYEDRKKASVKWITITVQ